MASLRCGLPAERLKLLTSFDQLGLAESLLRAIVAEGYEQPTPIQAQGIPAVLGGRDLVGIAQTGTGKTAAFVLPILQHLAAVDGRPAPKTCRALILAPTRELAIQIGDNIRCYSRYMRITHAVVIGGANPRPQALRLAGGVDIVVATPGRLLDHMSTGVVSLSQTAQVVLDEADQMLDMGFIPAIRKIMAKVADERQTMLFSATMPPEIRKLAADFMGEPIEVSVAPAARPIESIDQRVMHLPGGDKRGVLVTLLRQPEVERAIVFTRTKRGADKVAQTLAGAGISVDALHGNKSQGQRQRTLDGFRRGKLTVLVATDIAARGIDVDDVSHVVNFELPHVPEAYVHRIGRTARAGKSGQAISLCAHDERRLLRDIEKLTGKPLTVESAPEGAEVIASPPPIDYDRARREDRGERAHRGERGPRRPRAERSFSDDRQPREDQEIWADSEPRKERPPRAERQPRSERQPRADRPARPDRAPRPERQRREDRPEQARYDSLSGENGPEAPKQQRRKPAGAKFGPKKFSSDKPRNGESANGDRPRRNRGSKPGGAKSANGPRKERRDNGPSDRQGLTRMLGNNKAA